MCVREVASQVTRFGECGARPRAGDVGRRAQGNTARTWHSDPSKVMPRIPDTAPASAAVRRQAAL